MIDKSGQARRTLVGGQFRIELAHPVVWVTLHYNVNTVLHEGAGMGVGNSSGREV